ncbi:response regulator transcription factor [bacterium]|nr:response regulator transcription factor [bacterium]
MESLKVLLFLNRSKVGDKIEESFIRANFQVIRTDDYQNTLTLLKKDNPHVMVVDWDHAEGTTKRIIKLINDNYKKTGLVLLSKSKKAEERIHALEEGADDCLGQPPEIDELIAKVKAIIRRINLVDHAPKLLQVKDILINLDTHEVHRGDKLIDLTYTQFKLLYLMASRREYVFTRDEILEKVWGENAYVTNRTVDVHVKRLREKLGEYKQPSRYIQTIHGLGYRFV